MDARLPRFHRRSIRLKEYDYRLPGAYFVTLVTAERVNIFGEITAGEMALNDASRLIAALWQALPLHFPMECGDSVIMPNHMHGIAILQPEGIFDLASRGEAAGVRKIDSKSGNLPAASPLRPPIINPVSGTRPIGTVPGSLGALIQNFKSISTRRVNSLRNTPGAPLWQRNYYEHIIRDEKDWETIAGYIRANPLQWEEDENYR